MSSVICTYAYCIELFSFKHLKVCVFAFVASCSFNVPCFLELFSLAGYKVCKGYDFYVGLLLIAENMCFCYPSRTDNTDADFL